MSSNDSTSSYEAPQVSQISLLLHQQQKSRKLTIMEETCELSTNCKTENGQLLEDSGHHDLEENIRDAEDDDSRIGYIEENESEHLMTSVNKEEMDESQPIFGHVKKENEREELLPANSEVPSKLSYGGEPSSS